MTLALKTIINFMHFKEKSTFTTNDRDAGETLSISLFSLSDRKGLGTILNQRSVAAKMSMLWVTKSFVLVCLKNKIQLNIPNTAPESPLDCKEIKPANPKRNQPWMFIGRTDAETEAPILWPPDAKSWLTENDLDAGKDWGQEEKGTTEDEMVEWHHRLNGHEFEQTLGHSGGQRGLVCCSPWGRKELDMTEWLNNNYTL